MNRRTTETALLRYAILELEEVCSSPRQIVQLGERAADDAAATAMDRRGARRGHGIGHLDRKTAAILANDLESRPVARGGDMLNLHQRAQIDRRQIEPRLITVWAFQRKRSIAEGAQSRLAGWQRCSAVRSSNPT